MNASGQKRALIFVAAAGLVLVGCPSGDPTPTPSPDLEAGADEGSQVAIVVGAGVPLGRRDNLLAAVAALSLDLPDGIADVRAAVADDTTFEPDLLAFFADQGAGLVCGVEVANSMLQNAARAFPDVKFCLISDRDTAAAPVATVRIRIEEAAIIAGGLAASLATGPSVGFVAAARGARATLLLDSYTAGLLRVNPALEVVDRYLADTPGDADEQAASVVTALAEADLDPAFMVLGGKAAEAAIAASVLVDGQLIDALDTRPIGDDEGAPIATIVVDYLQVVKALLTARVESTLGTVLSLGLAEDAVALALHSELGESELVEGLRAEIIGGTLGPALTNAAALR